MIRSLGQQLSNQYGKVQDAFQGVANADYADYGQYSPSAQSGGGVQLAGTNNGGLTNPYAPDASKGQYGGSIGGHQVVWTTESDRTAPQSNRGGFDAAQQNADPLFFSPNQQMVTSGQGPENPGPPGTMYYSQSSNGWTPNAPGTTR